MFWVGKAGVSGCTPGRLGGLYLRRRDACDIGRVEMCREWCGMGTKV